MPVLIEVAVDLTGLQAAWDRVFMMNEQGARFLHRLKVHIQPQCRAVYVHLAHHGAARQLIDRRFKPRSGQRKPQKTDQAALGCDVAQKTLAGRVGVIVEPLRPERAGVHRPAADLSTTDTLAGETLPCHVPLNDLPRQLVHVELGQSVRQTMVAGEIVYRGTREQIRRMTDDEFKEIYGAEAERVSVGFTEGAS